ncbi:MAG: GNAT family N-acetyltransferase [Polymorphobacter sp.]|uniref:GNAT family N-acetyltransferase n=1 Tax=Polymorphobacter sp. TaxID=1909290 RepID=UPI003A85F1E1
MQPPVPAPPLVRRSRREDLARLAAIERSAAALFVGTHAAAFAAGPTTHPRTLARGHAAGLLWVSEMDGAVAGFLLAEPCPEGLYLRELSVAAAAQRRGHGRALMRAGIDHARAAGAAAVLLTTDRTLPWNAPFYARLGFRLCTEGDMPATLRARLDRQIAEGMDATKRCAMVLPLVNINE